MLDGYVERANEPDVYNVADEDSLGKLCMDVLSFVGNRRLIQKSLLSCGSLAPFTCSSRMLKHCTTTTRSILAIIIIIIGSVIAAAVTAIANWIDVRYGAKQPKQKWQQPIWRT